MCGRNGRKESYTMKKLPETLDELWSEQIRMFEDIAKRFGLDDNIDYLKEMWLIENDYGYIYMKCFFCEWTERQGQRKEEEDTADLLWCLAGGKVCPGAEVDPEFRCDNSSYYYRTKPKEFLAELKRLNKIRKEKQ